MTERRNQPVVAMPSRRRLRVFAFDPMTTRLTRRFLTVSIPYEPLELGPTGRLIQVIDTDVDGRSWYQPVDLEDPALMAQNGLRPAESDPRSHQQVVYAVAASVLERFERALGRRFRWTGDTKLALYPHASAMRNAYFSPDSFAVYFGFFKASSTDPGRNLPGQIVFTCLSVDLIVHEVTHAVVHDLRRFLITSTTEESRACHEALADIVALFHHFVFDEVVTDAIATAHGDIGQAHALFDLANEFGESKGGHGPLRTAFARQADLDQPSPALPAEDGTPGGPEAAGRVEDPHVLGAQLVQAVFAAYVATYKQRIADLLRIATGGTGELPPGSLHPDLVKRVAREATAHADRYLRIVVRGIDYLPVVDIDFGDVVRAMVTADRRLFPADRSGLRSALVEAMRQRGIYPRSILSLADESLPWPGPPLLEAPKTQKDDPQDAQVPEGPKWVPLHLNAGALEEAQEFVNRAVQDLDLGGERSAMVEPVEKSEEGQKNSTQRIYAFVRENAAWFGFEPDSQWGRLSHARVTVSFRDAEDRQPLPELLIQVTQRRRDLEDALTDRAGWEIRAATVIVAKLDGTIEHIIAKPLPFFDLPTALAAAKAGQKETILAFEAEGQRRLGALRARLRADKVGGGGTLAADDLRGDERAFAELDERVLQGPADHPQWWPGT